MVRVERAARRGAQLSRDDLHDTPCNRPALRVSVIPFIQRHLADQITTLYPILDSFIRFPGSLN